MSESVSAPVSSHRDAVGPAARAIHNPGEPLRGTLKSHLLYAAV